MDISQLRRQRYLFVLNAMIGRHVRLETNESLNESIFHGTFHTATPFDGMPHRIVVRISSATLSSEAIAEDVAVGATLVVDATKVKAVDILSIPLKETVGAALRK